jgi:predicted AAA+ superfamily ATPase
MIKRNIEENLKKYFKQYPVVVLTGPRQSGKTTIVKKLFPKLAYVNLEDLELREFAEEDPKGFLNQYGDHLIIDEVQRVPSLFSYIQLIVDEKKENGMYVLTGSQNLLLMEKINQSLAGRVAILKLLPFSMSELQNANKILKKDTISDILFAGFYPKIYDQKMDIAQYYLNYTQTYIERDVRLLKNIGNLSKFKRFLTLVAARVGQILNVTSLADDCGINYKTATEWLSILEASYIIFLLQPHYKNYNKRVTKMPKIYFYDTGLLCSLLNIEKATQVDTHFLKGGIFESFVIIDILKQRYNNAKKVGLFYWRDKLGNEVDLIVEQSEGVIPIEIKVGQTVRSDFFKGLNYYNNLAQIDSKKSYVVYGGNEKQLNKNGNVVSWRDITNILSE